MLPEKIINLFLIVNISYQKKSSVILASCDYHVTCLVFFFS